jgi:peroxiredoxin Q/BCP
MDHLTEGSKAPDFDLESDTGGRVRLSDFRGRPVVLYVFSEAGSPTCTEEAIAFSQRLADFERLGVTVIGLSPDPPAKLAKFRKKSRLSGLLAADVDRNTVEAYGIWVEKTLFGRTYMGVERNTFLIGRDGRIAARWRKVRLKGHVDAVLQAAAKLVR